MGWDRRQGRQRERGGRTGGEIGRVFGTAHPPLSLTGSGQCPGMGVVAWLSLTHTVILGPSAGRLRSQPGSTADIAFLPGPQQDSEDEDEGQGGDSVGWGVGKYSH